MARMMLRKEDPWTISGTPDIRGWEIQTADGIGLGFVEDVYVEPHDSTLAGFVTASGREFSPAEMELGSGVVRVPTPELLQSIRSALSQPGAYADAPATRDPGSFDAHYREHFENVYGRSGYGFEAYLPAYRFGRVQALEPRFSGRPYVRAEEDLRPLFELAHPNVVFEDVREAVRFGYEEGSTLRPTKDLDLLRSGEAPVPYERDKNLYRPAGEGQAGEQARRTADTMSTASTPQTAPDDTSMESQQRANLEGA